MSLGAFGQASSAYLYVAYPWWVRYLQAARERFSKFVFYFEKRTARFYDPKTGARVL
jgi:hypothetical protein